MTYTKLDYTGYENQLAKSGNYLGGYYWEFMFPNGYGASVIKHRGSYGSEDDLFELAVLKDGEGLCYSTPITDDVIGWLDNQEVLDLLKKISEL